MPHDIIDNRTRELTPEIKTYLFDFDPARIHAQTGAAIVSSSNLSLGGVTHNTELDVRVFRPRRSGKAVFLARWPQMYILS